MLYSSRDRGRHSSTPLLTQEEGNIPVHSLLSYSFTPPLSRQYLITEGIGHTRSDSNVAEIGVSYTRRYSDNPIVSSDSANPSTLSFEGTKWLYLRFSSETDAPEC